jgi:hypothetical protein
MHQPYTDQTRQLPPLATQDDIARIYLYCDDLQREIDTLKKQIDALKTQHRAAVQPQRSTPQPPTSRSARRSSPPSERGYY